MFSSNRFTISNPSFIRILHWNCHSILNKIDSSIPINYKTLNFFMKIDSTFNLDGVLETVKIPSVNNIFIYIYSIYRHPTSMLIMFLGCNYSSSSGISLFATSQNFSLFPINDGTSTFIFYSSHSSSVIDLTFVFSDLTPFCHWKSLNNIFGSNHILSITIISHPIRSRSFFFHNLHISKINRKLLYSSFLNQFSSLSLTFSIPNYLFLKKQEAATKRTLRKSKRNGWRSYCEILIFFTRIISTLWSIIKSFKNRYLHSVNLSSTCNYGISLTIENLINTISPSSCLHKFSSFRFDLSHEYSCRIFDSSVRLEKFFYVISPLKKNSTFINLFHSTPGKFCPISLTSYFLEILEKFIFLRLDWHSCGAYLFLDLANAFIDVIPVIFIFNLEELGLPPRLCQCVPQGFILSPILFNIYVAKLHKHIEEECDLIQFADDIAIFISSNKIEKTLLALESQVFKFFSRKDLTVSLSKSSLVIFTKKHIYPSIKLDSSTIQSVPSYKFLRVHLDFRLSGKDHIHALSTRCSKLLNILNVLRGTWWGGRSIECGYLVFPFNNYTLMDTLKKIQYRAICLCLGLRRTTPTNVLLAEAGEGLLRFRFNLF
ncbi:hypothetical protein ACFW04_013577 [Cataglyphis niger]